MNRLSDLIRNLPKSVKSIIAFISVTIGLAIVFRDNFALSLIVITVVLLGSVLSVCLYLLFTRIESPVQKGRFIYPYEKYRPIATLGIFLAILIPIVMISIPSMRQTVSYGFFGTPTPSPVRLVDISIEDGDVYPEIDVKVRNIGGEIAFLKRVNIYIEDHEAISTCYQVAPTVVLITGEYTVDLSSGNTHSVNVSQSIPANDVDRFKVITGIEHLSEYTIHVFRVRVEIVYNENDEVILSDPISMVLRPKSDWSFYFGEEGIRDSQLDNCFQQSREAALRIIDDSRIKTTGLISLENYITSID